MDQIDIDNFVKSYINTAFGLLERNGGMPLKDFDDSIREGLSKITQFSEEEIILLHHPFHWTFFCDENDSPFQYTQPKKSKELVRVLLEENRNDDETRLVRYFLEKYGGTLKAKMKNLGV